MINAALECRHVPRSRVARRGAVQADRLRDVQVPTGGIRELRTTSREARRPRSRVGRARVDRQARAGAPGPTEHHRHPSARGRPGVVRQPGARRGRDPRRLRRHRRPGGARARELPERRERRRAGGAVQLLRGHGADGVPVHEMERRRRGLRQLRIHRRVHLPGVPRGGSRGAGDPRDPGGD